MTEPKKPTPTPEELAAMYAEWQEATMLSPEEIEALRQNKKAAVKYGMEAFKKLRLEREAMDQKPAQLKRENAMQLTTEPGENGKLPS